MPQLIIKDGKLLTVGTDLASSTACCCTKSCSDCIEDITTIYITGHDFPTSPKLCWPGGFHDFECRHSPSVLNTTFALTRSTSLFDPPGTFAIDGLDLVIYEEWTYDSFGGLCSGLRCHTGTIITRITMQLGCYDENTFFNNPITIWVGYATFDSNGAYVCDVFGGAGVSCTFNYIPVADICNFDLPTVVESCDLSSTSCYDPGDPFTYAPYFVVSPVRGGVP